jgi:hypothetical protein
MMRSPEQQFAMAKRLPMQELVKVLQGQSDSVDMSIAEMVLRQKMQAQKAQQGAQAQQVAQGPKVVEKDLADFQALTQPRMEQGVAALPVGGIGEIGNMNGAGGGIVAFDDGGSVQHYQNTGLVQSPAERRGYSIFDLQNVAPTFKAGFESMFSPEDVEAVRLREQIRERMAGRGGPYAAFKPQTDEQMRENIRLSSRLNTMSLAELRALANNISTATSTGAPTSVPLVQTSGQRFVGSAKQGEGGDIRKADIAAGGQNSPAMPSQTAPYIPKNLRMADISEPTRPAEVNLPALLAQADAITKASSGTAPNVLTTKQGVERIYDAMREAGFDPKFFEKRVGELTKEKEQSKLDRREAAWLRTLEGAFETLGGESPYGFVNFGKGAAKAVKGIQEDLKDIKKIDRERDKAIRDVQAAEQDFRKSAGLTGLKEVQESQNRLDRFNEQRANRTNDLARTLYSGEIQKYVAMQPTGTERIIERSMRDPNYAVFAEKFAGRSGAGADPMADIIEHYAKNPLALERLKDSKDPQEIALYNAIKARLAAMSVPSASTRSTGIVRE